MISINKKVLIAISVALLLTTPIAALAERTNGFTPEEEEVIIPISAPINIDEEKAFQYIKFVGVIEEVDNSENFRVLVRRDVTEGLDVLWAYVNEDVLLLNYGTKDLMDKEDLVVGMEVSVIYHKDTVMALSYPPLLGPDVMIVHDEESDGFINVERFDEEIVSYDNFLKLNLGEETIILDENGDEYKGDLADRDLVVFYTFSTKSIPAQTTPEKIIVLDEKMDHPLYTVELSKDMILEESNVTLIPLRHVAEALGYEVTWNNDKRSVELVNGPHWSYLKIGENNYNFARMIVKLEMEPIILSSRTFVPLSFVEKVLQAQVQILENETITIYK